jgi:hypothetical protein
VNYLNERQLATIRRRWRDYAWAVGKVGLPSLWAFALAGVHYRESRLQDDARGEPGGPFCLDPEGEGDQLARIVDYARSVCVKYGHSADDLSLESDFRTAALVAAHELRSKAPRPIGDTEPEIGLALARYNGFPRYYNELWQTGAGSNVPAVRWHPYVSNDPGGGRQLSRAGSILKADGSTVQLPKSPDANPGALIIAREIRARWDEWFRTGDERAPA